MLGDAAATDDVLQEAYYRAFRSRADFAGTADGLSAWLYRIVYNTCIDHLRATKRRIEISLDILHDGTNQTAVQDPGVDESDALVERDAIREAMATLTPEQSAAVVLIDLHELPYAEVAEILGISIGTLSSRVNRGRQALRKHLGPNEQDRRAI